MHTAAVDWILCLSWSLGHATLTALVNRTTVNTGVTYDAILLDLGRRPARRWVGRCKTCRKAHRVDGVLARGRFGGCDHDIAISGERAFCTADQGAKVYVACCGARVRLERVYDDHKPNRPRHECNAKCLASTGPACECKCRGANHGGSAHAV